jgi:hypothetical protein
MLKHAPPDWNDEKGVARLADDIIAENERRAKLFIDYSAWAANADAFAKFERSEADAVDATARGNFAPLAKLIQDEHWYWLQPTTRELIADAVLGKRRRVGRRKMLREARRLRPIHRATAECTLLKLRLRELYPTISRAMVRERAVEIAAARTGVSPEALQRQLGRSRKDPHRIS